MCLINREYEQTNERVLHFTNVEIPAFINYSIYYREYNLEGYRVVLEKLQMRLNYQKTSEYIQEKGARMLTADEIGYLIDQE